MAASTTPPFCIIVMWCWVERWEREMGESKGRKEGLYINFNYIKARKTLQLMPLSLVCACLFSLPHSFSVVHCHDCCHCYSCFAACCCRRNESHSTLLRVSFELIHSSASHVARQELCEPRYDRLRPFFTQKEDALSLFSFFSTTLTSAVCENGIN